VRSGFTIDSIWPCPWELEKISSEKVVTGIRGEVGKGIRCKICVPITKREMLVMQAINIVDCPVEPHVLPLLVKMTIINDMFL